MLFMNNTKRKKRAWKYPKILPFSGFNLIYSKSNFFDSCQITLKTDLDDNNMTK